LQGFHGLFGPLSFFKLCDVAQDNRVTDLQRQLEQLCAHRAIAGGGATNRTHETLLLGASPGCPSPEERAIMLLATVWPNRTSSRPGGATNTDRATLFLLRCFRSSHRCLSRLLLYVGSGGCFAEFLLLFLVPIAPEGPGPPFVIRNVDSL